MRRISAKRGGDRHVPRVVALYQPRFNAMLEALGHHFPEWMRWSNPEGGMIVWAESSIELDLLELYQESVRHNVAYVPGTFFFAQSGAGRNTMRLNFTMNSEKRIGDAI